MAITGATYPSAYRLTRAVFWHSLQWRSEKMWDEIKTALHGQVRRQSKKKPKWTRLLIIDFPCCEEYVQRQRRVQRILSLAFAPMGESFGADNLSQNLSSSNVIKSRYFGNANITHCTQANVTDDQGLIEMLNHNA